MLNAHTDKVIEINKLPNMKLLVGKGLFLAMIRPNLLNDSNLIQKGGIILKGVCPDPTRLTLFKNVCQYPLDNLYVPTTYIQTLFTGLIGKYIASNLFPLNPLRLIHTFQKIIQIRQININHTLNLWCEFKGAKPVVLGTELTFELQAMHKNQMVWQGISAFLIKKPRSTSEQLVKKESVLPLKKSFDVPIDIGRKYAKASGDYNLHHISSLFAKTFRFKSMIAHGMWSLARALATIERKIKIKYPLEINTFFHIPIFLPNRVSLGYKMIEAKNNNTTQLLFELRNYKKKFLHITGSLIY